MNRILIVFSVALLLAPLVSGAVYVKFDGVDGESTDDAHTDEIDVLAWSWGMHRERNGDVTMSDVTISKMTDASSTVIQRHAASGEPMGSLILGAADGRQTYLVIELEEAIISSYHIHASGNDVPTEEVAFYYNKVQFSTPAADGTDTTIVFTGLE